jgi:hypothetical protein
MTPRDEGPGAENPKRADAHDWRMTAPERPDEHLRRALVDLQEAQRRFAATHGRPGADVAAKGADEARAQAARWATLARAATRIERSAGLDGKRE